MCCEERTGFEKGGGAMNEEEQGGGKAMLAPTSNFDPPSIELAGKASAPLLVE